MKQITYRVKVFGGRGEFVPKIFIKTDYGDCSREIYYDGADTWETKEKARQVGEQIGKRLIKEEYK